MENDRTKIVVSSDGSNTLFSERFGESYRSAGGAAEESLHTFVRGGLFRYCGLPPFNSTAAGEPLQINGVEKKTKTTPNPKLKVGLLLDNRAEGVINILEYGFGTGLNAYTTLKAVSGANATANIQIRYTSVDLFPLTREEYSAILPDDIEQSDTEIFHKLHSAEWIDGRYRRPGDIPTTEPKHDAITDGCAGFTAITQNFSLRKILCDFRTFEPALYDTNGKWLDVIYFDPFSPASEPECWCEDIFSRIRKVSKDGAVLTTYSAKGDVKRALRATGWNVFRVPGTGTKRHNVIAVNNLSDGNNYDAGK